MTKKPAKKAPGTKPGAKKGGAKKPAGKKAARPKAAPAKDEDMKLDKAYFEENARDLVESAMNELLTYDRPEDILDEENGRYELIIDTLIANDGIDKEVEWCEPWVTPGFAKWFRTYGGEHRDKMTDEEMEDDEDYPEARRDYGEEAEDIISDALSGLSEAGKAMFYFGPPPADSGQYLYVGMDVEDFNKARANYLKPVTKKSGRAKATPAMPAAKKGAKKAGAKKGTRKEFPSVTVTKITHAKIEPYDSNTGSYPVHIQGTLSNNKPLNYTGVLGQAQTDQYLSRFEREGGKVVGKRPNMIPKKAGKKAAKRAGKKAAKAASTRKKDFAEFALENLRKPLEAKVYEIAGELGVEKPEISLDDGGDEYGLMAEGKSPKGAMFMIEAWITEERSREADSDDSKRIGLFVEVLTEDGNVVGMYAPYNFTNKYWTASIDVIKERIDEMDPGEIADEVIKNMDEENKW